jgi:hypothetical protein
MHDESVIIPKTQDELDVELLETEISDLKTQLRQREQLNLSINTNYLQQELENSSKDIECHKYQEANFM